MTPVDNEEPDRDDVESMRMEETGVAADVRAERTRRPVDIVVVDAGVPSVIEAGIATGQKLHICLP